MDKTIAAYIGEEKTYHTGELATCPRCGYTAQYFDQLAIQPNFVQREDLRPVYKCPECKHLFALVADVA